MLTLSIGITIGIVLGLTGAGGSIFAVPLLMLLLAVPATEAMGIALGAVSITALYGTAIRWRARQFLLLPAILIGSTGVIAAPFGKWTASLIDSQLLMLGFSLLATVIAFRLWRQANLQPNDTCVVRAAASSETFSQTLPCRYSPSGQFELKPRCIAGLMIGGVIVGLLSGLFGVGGGFLIVPLLLGLSQLPIQMAVGTSLLIIAPVSLSGFISFVVMSPAVNYIQLATIALGGIVGMFAGTALSRYVTGKKLQQFFALSIIALSFMTLAKQWQNLS